MVDNDADSQTAFDVTHGGRNHVVNANLDPPDPSLQSGVDAFFKSMVPTYRTPTGNVDVATPFMMNPGYPDQRAFKAKPANKAAMADLASSAGISGAALTRIQEGRGTPDEIHTLTQALIDQQPANMVLLNPDGAIWQPNDVRKLMHNHAIGIDCAGYVQQAYLRATGRRRDQVGFVPELLNEGLFGLQQKGYAKFMAVADLRPGDIIVFNAPPGSDQPGHRTIVFDQRLANDDDNSAILGAAGGTAFVSGATVRVLEMDSSYGSGGYYGAGGVQREKWIFNEASKQWAHLHLDDQASSGAGDPVPWLVDHIGTLYGPDDVLDGFYRRRGR